MIWKKIKKIFKNEMVSYLFFGVLTTIVNYASFLLFYEGLHINSLVSNAIAFVFAVVFSFVTNKLFVFESSGWSGAVLIKEAGTFVGGRLATFFLEEIGILGCELLRLGDVRVTALGFTFDGITVAKILLSVIVVIINYVVCKLWVFKK